MKRLLPIIVCFYLSSCGAKQIIWSDGQQALFARCTGSMEACYAKASKACPKGYSVLASEGTVADAIAGIRRPTRDAR